MRELGIVVILLLISAGVSKWLSFSSSTAPSGSLREQLEVFRQKYHLPALAAAIVTSKGLVEMEAVGVRKAGTTVPVTKDDLWHLGSDTKAMTALVIGSLVQQGKLQWDATIEQIFPDIAPGFPADFRKITLRQLLAHRAGLPPNLDWGELSKSGSVMAQRVEAVKAAAKTKLLSAPGTKYSYANTGYVLVGAIAEKITGKRWEDLITEMVFKPLGMSSAGFGGTGTPGQLDQPWGHTDDGTPVSGNGPMMDNPPVMGPAGRVHCSLPDWAKFIADQLRGENGQPALLPAAIYHQLHEPAFGGDYAPGWLVMPRDWAGGLAYNHAGSNTMNYALVWMAPKKDFAVLVVTNLGIPAAAEPCDEVASALITGYLAKTK